MKKKSYAIFGLGRFGASIAQTLIEAECEVMIIDRNDDHLQEFARQSVYAVKADVTEQGTLESIGLRNVDVAIIAIAGNLEANIMTAMYAKEVGVKEVVAKCSSPLHGAILDKIGVDNVIYPEKEMGKRVAKNLLTGGFVDLFELSDDFSMAELQVPSSWVGQSLQELNIRDTYKVNVVAIKNGEDINVNIDPQEPLKAEEMLIILGNNVDLNKMSR